MIGDHVEFASDEYGRTQQLSCAESAFTRSVVALLHDTTRGESETQFDINPDLKTENQCMLLILVKEFQDVFADNKPSTTHLGEYTIDT